MKKRLLSIVLVLSLLLSMSPVAFATGAAVGETTLAAMTVTNAEGLTKALADGNSVILGADIALDADDTIKIVSGNSAVIDLNKYTLSGASDETGANRNMFDVRGTLTVKNGTITVEHTGANMGWNNSTNVFHVEGGGVLNIENATIKNLGGSDMAFCVHLNNWGEVTLNAKNTTFESTYVGIRAFNSGNDMNNVNLDGCNILTGNSCFWVHNYTAADFSNDETKATAAAARLNLKFTNTTVARTNGSKSLIRFGFTNSIYYSGVDMTEVVAGTEKAIKWAVENGKNILLNNDLSGSGIVIDKDITIDLNGHTYTFNSAVGSSGTETLGFQILKDNKVTIKNGTLTSTAVASGKEVKVLIQNYANLTLTDVNLVDNTDHILYALSNNCGVTVLNGETSITTDAVAFDVYDYSAGGYSLPTVTVNTTGTITGDIKVSDTCAKNLTITGGAFTKDITKYVPEEGYAWLDDADAEPCTWYVGPSYTISIDPNGGSFAEGEGYKIATMYGGLLDLGTVNTEMMPSRSGYTFKGWYDAAEGGNEITAKTEFTTNDTIYAQWVKDYVVKFVDGEDVISQTYKAGETIVAPEKPSSGKDGYTFKGWSGYTKGITATEDMTFTAVWIEEAVQEEIADVIEKIETPVVESKPVAEDVVVPDDVAPEANELATEIVTAVKEMEVTNLETAAVTETAKVIEEVQKNETVIADLQLAVGYSEEIKPENIKVQPVVTVNVAVAKVETTAATADAPAAKTLVLNIEPQVSYKASIETSLGETKSVDVPNSKQELNTEGIAVDVTVPVPASFAKHGEKVTVVHTKDDGRVFFYDAEVDGDKITFTNPNGFSTFAIISSSTVGEVLENHYDVAFAYAYSKLAPYIPTVQSYLYAAIETVSFEILPYVFDMEVPEQLEDTRNILINELTELEASLHALYNILYSNDLNTENVEALIASINMHGENIIALGEALGGVGLEAWDQLHIASDMVADWADDVYETAYNYLLDTDAEFKAEYDALVADIVAEIDVINPKLGDIVKEYLTETPAAAMKYIAGASKAAYAELIAASLEMTDDINDFVSALSAIVELAEVEKMVDVMKTQVVQDALAIAAEAVAEYNKVMDMPVTDAINYPVDLAAAKDAVVAAQGALVAAIVNQMQEVVDPAVYAAAVKAWNALCDLADDAAVIGGAYAEYLGESFDLLAGDLLALIIENTKTYGLMAGAVIDEMIRDLIEGIAIEIEEEMDDVLGQIEFSVDLSEIKALIAELETTAAEIRTQIAAAKAYTGELLDAEIETLEAALYAIETYAAELNAFVTNVETLVNGIDLTEMTIDSVKKLVAQAQVLAADAETLVDDAKASFAILTAIYEKVMPKVIELAAYIEEGSPMDIALDTADNKIGAFIAVSESGYNTTVAELETAAANIEIIVTETLGVVSEAVAVALDELTVATETATDDIFAAAEDAIAVIKAEAIALANSTDAEIAAAGQEILALVENFEITVSEAEFEAKHAEVMALVDSVITAVQAVDSIEDAEAILTQATEALEALHTIAKDVYAIAEGDVITVLGEAETLAEIAKAVVESAASTIGANAVAAYEVSADAICTAVDTSIEAVNTAIAAYETAIVNAMNIIVPAVTEAVEEITVEVTGVAETAVKAVEASIERAEECEAIIDALENVVYDATHGEIVGDCAGKIDTVTLVGTTVTENIKDADLITVKFDDGEFMTFAYEQVMGIVADVINDSVIPQMMTNRFYGPAISSILAEYEIDLTKSYDKDALEWSKFEDSALLARDEILVVVENVLREQLVAQNIPEEFTYDLGPMVIEILNEGIENEEEWAFKTIVIELEIHVFDLLMTFAENALYGYFEFAAEFPATLNTIRETAPNAHVAVIGISNNVASVLPAIVTDNIDISEYNEYIDYVVDALNLHLFTYAAINTSTTFVEDGNVADAIEIMAGEHVYDEPEFSWVGTTLTGTLTCGVCADGTPGKVLTDSADGVVKSSTAGDCTTLGTTTYEATVTLNGQDYTKEITIEGAYGPHTYGEPEFSWEGTTLTGTLTCNKCENNTPGKVLTDSADGVVKSSTAGNCTTLGTTTYEATVTLNGQDYTKEITIDGTYGPHNYGVWFSNGSSGHKRVCANDSTHVETEAHDYGSDRVCDICSYVKPSGGGGAGGGGGIVYDKGCPRDKTCPMYGYTDLNMTSWYHDAVHYCIEKGLMIGTGKNIFEPNIALTRAMMVQILYNLEGRPVYTVESNFSDVFDGAWYEDCIHWAAQQGFVNGYPEGDFRPNQYVSRQEMATMLWRYAGSKETSHDLSSYTDADTISGYARTAMAWANENGIINGMTDNTLAPTGDATRAQIAQLMMNYLAK